MEYIKKKKRNYIEFSSNEILISTRSSELLSIESIHRNVKFLLFEQKIVTNEENNWISFIPSSFNRFDEIEFYYKCTYFSILVKELTRFFNHLISFLLYQKKKRFNFSNLSCSCRAFERWTIVKGLSKRLGL